MLPTDWYAANFFAKEHSGETAHAGCIAPFLTTAALPSLADGTPMPTCTPSGCTKPQLPN
jgi:hypothetical protein